MLKCALPIYTSFSEVDYSTAECGHIYCCKEGFDKKIENRMANSVDPNETAHYDPSRLELHY